MRDLLTLQPVDVTWVLHEGRRLAHFGGSDYFRLSWHPRIREACAEGSLQHGPSAGASRMTTGNLPVYGELEVALARFFGAESVTLTSSGYLAPMVVAQGIASQHERVLLDERAHVCLVDAAELTGLPIARFPHRDPDALKRLASASGSDRLLVMTDGLFSHSGEIALLAEYLKVLPDSATLLVDDAHGVGVLGEHGRGAVECAGVSSPRLIIAGTLSKAFGCYGGFILAPADLRQTLITHSRIFTGNTAVPPPCAMAALAAIDVLRKEGAERRARLHRNIERAKANLKLWEQRGPGPMFSLAPPDPSECERLKALLLEADIFPPHIRYPNGPAPRYFRFAISSEHTDGQLDALHSVLGEFMRQA